jgi:hypothetical protein
MGQFITESTFPRFLLSGREIGERETSDLLSILKILTVKNGALALDCRGDNQ